MNQHQNHSYFDLPKPTSSPSHPATSHNMPAISEDEILPEADEPAEHFLSAPQFSKTTPPSQVRRNSMLTKALHTDSESHTESHDESLGFTSFRRQASRSSTCSTWSAPSDATSEDGVASLSNSPSRPIVFRKPDFVSEPSELRKQTPSPAGPISNPETPAATRPVTANDNPADASEDTPVEQQLGRRRCISFACGGQKKDAATDKKADVRPLARSTTDPVPNAAPAPVEQKKRQCMIKFQCPTKVSDACLDQEKSNKHPRRRASPAPSTRSKSPTPTVIRAPRSHRNSDSTIKEESPRSTRKVPPLEPRKSFLEEEEPEPADENRFAAFASKEEKVEHWTEENTCHRSRLTVDDYLSKEKTLQKLGEEAEEEAQDEDNDDFDDGLDSDDDRMSDGSGFDTDDEDGFAESDDDDSDGDSDYEWWAPRKTHAHPSARLAPGDDIRPPALHADDDSYESSVSPRNRGIGETTPRKKLRHSVEPVNIRPPTPELPDSTDFVCGTLDEDKPLEEAYASIIQARKAAKHHSRPQDIDPTFPTDIASDDDDEDDGAAQDSDQPHFLHGSIEDIGDEVDRGRTPHARGRSPRSSPPQAKRSPAPAGPAVALTSQRLKSPMPPPSHAALQRRPKSPAPPAKAGKRAKSPMPVINTAVKPSGKKGQVLRSPPPRLLFGHSPRRNKSPHSSRKISPAPSRRGTPPDFKPMPFSIGFLGQRPSLTHTSSLPRSPNIFARKRNPYEGIMPESDDAPDIDDDDAEDTAKENKGGYERGAIDIVQGLERKRLRRRQKFYERYCRKEEKKAQRREKQLEKQAEKQAEKLADLKRPQPGKGAQRMRQVGIECALYRGKHVLSV